MKIIIVLKDIAKKSTAARILMRKMRNVIKSMFFKICGVGIRPQKNIIIFGAFNGKSYACSPKAVYEYMRSNDEFGEYEFIWIFDNPDNYIFLTENRNTRIVKNGTIECEKCLHQAGYWFLNFRAPDHWKPSDKQVYIQCWHGTPLKRLGYDLSATDNSMNSIKEIREKYRTDAERFSYLVSPCRFATEKFITAWNLHDTKRESDVLEIGYPRNDYLTRFTSSDAVKIMKKLGICDCEKKIILYAPTWRDNQHDSKLGYVYENPVDFDLLKAQLGEDYMILFRAHYFVANSFDFKKYDGFIYDVSDYDDINELYIVSDMLITDYSSVFFDYAILQRPMFFYMYDIEEYRDEMRGFYLDLEELPGPIVENESELIMEIKNVWDVYNFKKVKEFNNIYNSLNDGYASKRLVSRVINCN